ncbi:MAG: single-stranded DNA-binding protein [Chloroflexi bacterium]|nr:single-stranded DNA-binding protein [Chloroflexota bacterium]|tara:strand:- start:7751 stop:8098 length:348 start_codon:yes stop_codon:yes gene_type:complete
MSSANVVVLMGNLTRDPELKEISKGTSVCEFGLAVNHEYTDKKGERQKDVSFFDINAWNKTGEACHEYLEKGRGVHVVGRLKQERWETDQGDKRSRIRVVAHSVQFLPRAQNNEE